MKIMIVDDESIVRIAFMSLLNWSELDCTITEASNGKDALENIDQIDVLVTDIKMPVMDGFALIEKVSKLDVPPVIFVLSAFDDFVYVKNTFKMGIADYILKSDINEKTLMNLYNSAVTLLQSRSSAPGKTDKPETLHDKDYWDFTSDILLNNKVYETEINEACRKFGIPVTQRKYYGIFFQICRYSEITNRYADNDLPLFRLAFLNSVSEILAVRKNYFLFPVSNYQFFVIAGYKINSSNEECESEIRKIIKGVSTCVRNNLNIDISAGVSNPDRSEPPNLHAIFVEARKAIGFNFFTDDMITFLRSYPEPIGTDVSKYDTKSMLLDFRKSLWHTNDRNFTLSINKFLVDSHDYSSIDMSDVLNLYTSYYKEMNSYTNSNLLPHNVLLIIEDFGRDLLSHECLPRLNDDIIMIFNTLIHYYTDKTNLLVEQAKAYIVKNYDSPISLSKVASEFKISEEHLSRLFSKSSESNFSHFLNKVRIDNAKKLLMSGQYKIYEVSDLVGYSSTEHFSRTFKEYTGTTPRAFMNNIELHNNEA